MGIDTGNTSASRDSASIALTFAVLGAALLIVFIALDRWAAYSFARPILASLLVAVCDMVLFVLALSLAPVISRAFQRILGR